VSWGCRGSLVDGLVGWEGGGGGGGGGVGFICFFFFGGLVGLFGGWGDGRGRVCGVAASEWGGSWLQGWWGVDRRAIGNVMVMKGICLPPSLPLSLRYVINENRACVCFFHSFFFFWDSQVYRY